ncbi:YqcI/YcgG family protein [Photobacterium galatheae]|uniref:Uncharacterized protein n=1 Tax=Photobacterium galatheae TaxID=1654360 RepID=A0A066RWE7_9GAMM|nr:YqcI/YcgG family protein [Photobacterium galatheae]KDM92027.1 hypothetical protein EA58_08410 [Photobacterium galatheae]MCM0151062.1 YqcI/YcgG family protein [Photobacterium galatheae]
MLIQQKAIQTVRHSPYSWVEAEFHRSTQVIMEKDFPCTFGILGAQKEVHYISALNFPYSAQALAEDITQYLSEIRAMPAKERGVSGLLVYFEPIGAMSLQSLQLTAWELLSQLERYDETPWPAGVSRDPADPDYAFCFQGEVWFINFSSSGYANRDSRNLGSQISLAMQAFSASDEYFNYNNKRKANAQKLVRSRAEKFDGCPVHHGLGPIIGEEKPSPLKLSYFIGDTNQIDSFEPWLYETISADFYLIDEEIVSWLGEANFRDAVRRMNQLGKEVIVVDDPNTSLTEQVRRLNTTKDVLWITSNPAHTHICPEEHVYCCCLRKDSHPEEIPGVLLIDHLFDTFALIKPSIKLS